MRKMVLLLMIGVLWTLPVVGAELSVFNGDFEMLPVDVSGEKALGLVPYGWSASFTSEFPPDITGLAMVELTDERVVSGQYAMKITRAVTPHGGILTSSAPLPVTEGVTYAVMANIWNVRQDAFDNKINVYIEFWRDEGWWTTGDFWSEQAWHEQKLGAWGTAKRLADHHEKSTLVNEWEPVIVIGKAPVGATYMTVSFWTGHLPTQVYVDDVLITVIQ